MTLDLQNFCERLIGWMADTAELDNSVSPYPLSLMTVDEMLATDPYSVLAPYTGGRVPWVPVPVIPLQVMTTGSKGSQTIARAQVLFNTLFDATSKQPLRDQAIDGFRFSILDARPPGVIGRDEKKRLQMSFNFDARFIAV